MKNAHLILFVAGIFISISVTSQKLPERSPDSRLILQKGLEYYENGEYKKAAETFGSVHQNDSSYLLSLYEKALSLQADSSYEDALRTIDLALKVNEGKNPDHDYLLVRANLLDDMGKPQEALKIYDAVLAKYPLSAGARSQKTTTLFRLKQYDEAETLIRECITMNFINPLYHYKLGYILYNQGKIVPSMMALTMANIVNPSHANKGRVVNYLSFICNAKDEPLELQQNRKAETYPDVFNSVEQIVFSKIALDKGYKTDLNLDDNILRQIYVMMEKLEFNAEENDPYMQLYVPFYKELFANKDAEVMLNHAFSGLGIEAIDNYLKKNKKEHTYFKTFAYNYCNSIRTTRITDYKKRSEAKTAYYHFSDERFFAEGKFENDKAEGSWLYYYPAGNIKAKGSYVNNEKEGEWTYYYDNGALQATETFRQGKNMGTYTSYYTNGIVKKQANYKDDLQEGVDKGYSFFGALISEENYQKGKLHGVAKYYYNDGRLKSQFNYNEGTLNGAYKLYYQNQVVKEEGAYKAGELDGLFKIYYSNGKLSSELQYTNGKSAGLWKYYHKNGKLNYQVTTTEKGSEGEVMKYDEEGFPESKEQYKEGTNIGTTEYYYKGKAYVLYKNNNKGKTAEITYVDSTGKQWLTNKRSGKLWTIAYYSPLGHKMVEKNFDQDEQLTGEAIYYNAEGTITAKENYEKGELTGTKETWYFNKKKSEVAQYKEGNLDGTVWSYNQNGSVSAVSFYDANVLQDYQYDYDQLGKLQSVYHYLNGEKHGLCTVFYPNGKKYYEEVYEKGWLLQLIQYDTLGNAMKPVVFEKGNGVYKLLHPNGKLYFEQTMVNGVWQGVQKAYFPDGVLMSEIVYKNDQKEGTAKYYYSNGKISGEGNFLYDLKVGTWKSYDNNGLMDELEEYTDGVLDGVCKYYQDGKLTREISYRDGERHGVFKRYSMAGELMYQTENYYGNIISYTYQDKNKKLVPPIYLKNGTGNLVAYFPNGTKAADLYYSSSFFNGTFKLYNEKGILVQESEDEYGYGKGVNNTYYENGKIRTTISYKGDLVDGVYKEFYADGKLKEEAVYVDGVLHGPLKKYDATGKLLQTHTYYYGYITDIKK